MRNRVTVRKLKAKELGPTPRRRLHLAADEEVEVTVTKRPAARKRTAKKKDPWLAIKGTLSEEEADEMIRAINEGRSSGREGSSLN